MVDLFKKRFMLDPQNLLFLVIRSTKCLSLIQWYIKITRVRFWLSYDRSIQDFRFLKKAFFSFENVTLSWASFYTECY